jgi:hypothetical protein
LSKAIPKILYFRPKYEFCQERNCKENGKIYKKNKKNNFIENTKTHEKNPANQSKAAEYAGHLLELHKLQGTLLNRLNREV